ncbi:hypothetical protein CI109_105988 [Kwoniella shandongensis]|uniref:TLC domain-containing protein n=1 Tax=Kwoniella shandongensis TaxID=1734106 RepID=A0A5M6C289_9TREE|nr:uncharacterized protein CI109_003964 [Kwoniella shandongensis]KAA5527705.1 hypothetical protein CI109_003964 [Kwoniella shandongensis]
MTSTPTESHHYNPLPLLGPHLPTLLLSTAGWYCVQYLSHRLSPRWISKYGEFDERTRRGWATHVVSMVHALIVIPLAIRCLSSTSLKQDPLFGYDPFVGHVLAFSSGYFLWDTIDSSLNSTIGFVIHGAACLAVFLFSFRPFLAGFGPPFLLWELSTPFLNIHWFMDKAGLNTRYPTFFLVNALVFMLVFFLARIVYGGANSLLFFNTMWQERANIPLHLQVIYCGGNLALNALNWLWFSKMLKKMIARLSGGETTKGKDVSAKPKVVVERTPLLDKAGEVSIKEEEEDDLVAIGEEEKDETLSLPAKAPKPVKSAGVEEKW